MSIRVDFAVECGPVAGMGHLSRAMTLARALRSRQVGVRLFLTDVSSLAANPEFPVLSLDQDKPQGADMLVVDGLRIPASLITAMGAGSRALTVIDDLGRKPLACDILVNHNIYGDRLRFAAYQSRIRLLGPRYALIRPEFAAARNSELRIEPRVLVSFGGGLTGRTGLDVACRIANDFSGRIDVVLGPSVPTPDAPLPPNVIVVRGGNMPELMARATIYVGSLGVTFLEALAAGLPAVVTPVAPDQNLALEVAGEFGANAFETPDPDVLARAALRGMQNPKRTVFDQPDGHGAERVGEVLVNYVSSLY
jgi:UDP-2,4-diacetamido-2,4,6-trideoxy-beta-L-altropyranose hydrolase